MTALGKWHNRWIEYPFPTMGEPEKAVTYLTDIGDYVEDHNQTSSVAYPIITA